jgi:putative salt-induced outer membrane protein YdiY
MRKLVVSLVLAASPAWAVVDIAPQEVGTHPGFSGNLSVSYSSDTGNTEKDELDTSGKLQYDNRRNSVAFIQGTYERSKASGVETEDDTLIHARYLHRLYGETLYGEGFVQLYENAFRGIERRVLMGGNLRWRFAKIPRVGKLYLGAGVFQEEVKYTGDFPEEDESLTRMNSYLAYTRPLAEKSDLSMIGYYQPAFESARDYYASFNAELTLHVVFELYLSFTYEFDYDASPPEGIEKEDQKIKTSLVWKF